MRACKCAVLALIAFTLQALPVAAQDAQTVEVTPYVAIGSAGASPVGAAVTFPLTSTLRLETDVAYRRGEGRLHALSTTTSLLWLLPRVGQSTPYVAGGLGLAQYGAPVFASSGPPIGTEPRQIFPGVAENFGTTPTPFTLPTCSSSHSTWTSRAR